MVFDAERTMQPADSSLLQIEQQRYFLRTGQYVSRRLAQVSTGCHRARRALGWRKNILRRDGRAIVPRNLRRILPTDSGGTHLQPAKQEVFPIRELTVRLPRGPKAHRAVREARL